jgi:hypothetical protein
MLHPPTLKKRVSKQDPQDMEELGETVFIVRVVLPQR